MKICLIAGNSPQYVVNLPKEIHRLKLRGMMRKYIAKLISCGITVFYVNAESVIKTAVEEVLCGFNKESVSAAYINCGGAAFGAVIAVWGWGANGVCGAVRTASDNGLPFVVIDVETLSVTSFKI